MSTASDVVLIQRLVKAHGRYSLTAGTGQPEEVEIELRRGSSARGAEPSANGQSGGHSGGRAWHGACRQLDSG